MQPVCMGIVGVSNIGLELMSDTAGITVWFETNSSF